jgi:putative FmdB family regulatory protein
MPIFVFQCNDCGHTFEKIQKTKDKYPTCPTCDNSNIQQVLGVPSAPQWNCSKPTL